MKRLLIIVIIILWAIAIPFILSLIGCSSTGFEKGATLMPDRIGISFGQQKFQEHGGYCPGVTFNAQWDLKYE